MKYYNADNFFVYVDTTVKELINILKSKHNDDIIELAGNYYLSEQLIADIDLVFAKKPGQRDCLVINTALE